MKFLLNYYGPLIPHSFSAKCIKLKKADLHHLQNACPTPRAFASKNRFPCYNERLCQREKIFSLPSFVCRFYFSSSLFPSLLPFAFFIPAFFILSFFASSQHQAEYEVCASASLSEFTIGALGV